MSEDEERTHGELLSENRRRRRRLVRKIKELNAREDFKKAQKPEEQYRRDTLDQMTFMSPFTGQYSHVMFREDFITETLTRRDWQNLVKIKSNSSELNLLDSYMILTYEDLVGAKNERQPNIVSTSPKYCDLENSRRCAKTENL